MSDPAPASSRSQKVPIIVGTVIGSITLLLLVVISTLLWRRKLLIRRRHAFRPDADCQSEQTNQEKEVAATFNRELMVRTSQGSYSERGMSASPVSSSHPMRTSSPAPPISYHNSDMPNLPQPAPLVINRNRQPLDQRSSSSHSPSTRALTPNRRPPSSHALSEASTGSWGSRSEFSRNVKPQSSHTKEGKKEKMRWKIGRQRELEAQAPTYTNWRTIDTVIYNYAGDGTEEWSPTMSTRTSITSEQGLVPLRYAGS